MGAAPTIAEPGRGATFPQQGDIFYATSNLEGIDQFWFGKHSGRPLFGHATGK
jgi:hypothetical protein